MKKSFSKILSAVLVLILIASLCGCTQPVEEEPNNPNIPDDPTPGIVMSYDTLEEYLAQTIEDEVWIEAEGNLEKATILSDNPKAEEFAQRWETEGRNRENNIFTPCEIDCANGVAAKYEIIYRAFAIYGDYLYTCGFADKYHSENPDNPTIGHSHMNYYLYEININTEEKRVLEDVDLCIQRGDYSSRNVLDGFIDNLWVSSNALLYQSDGALILRLRSTDEILEIWPKKEDCFVMLTQPLSNHEFLFAVESAEFKQYIRDNHINTMTSHPALGWSTSDMSHPPALDYYVCNAQLDKTYFLGKSSVIREEDLRDFGDPKIPELLEQYYAQRDIDKAAIN